MNTAESVYVAIVAVVDSDKKLRDSVFKNREIFLKNIESLVEEFDDMSVYEKMLLIVNSVNPEIFMSLASSVIDEQ